jgi:hypothetical protein
MGPGKSEKGEVKADASTAPTRRLTWPRALALVGVVVVAFTAAGVVVPTYDLTDADKAEAARRVVAWVVENKPLPGSSAAYPDAAGMAACKRFYVLCDFLPEDAPLSDDPRVRRVSATEFDERFKKEGYADGTDYLEIRAAREGDGPFALKSSNLSGPLAGREYQFEFRKKLWGVQTSVHLLPGA